MFQEPEGQISGNQIASKDQKNLGTMQERFEEPERMLEGTKDSRKMADPGTGGTDVRSQKA